MKGSRDGSGPAPLSRGQSSQRVWRAVRMLPGWAALWNGLWMFVLGRDRIDSQYVGWRQAYAAYFGIRQGACSFG
jgi:hypothetical protein